MDHVESKAEVNSNVVCVCVACVEVVWWEWPCVWCVEVGCGGYCMAVPQPKWCIMTMHCCSVCGRVRVRDRGMLEKDNEHAHTLSFVIIGVLYIAGVWCRRERAQTQTPQRSSLSTEAKK